MMKLPATPAEFLRECVNPGLALLPPRLDTLPARVWLTTIALQEAGEGKTAETRVVAHRWQVVDLKRPEKKGPARSVLQFELGTRKSKGGVWGVFLHAASKGLLQMVCDNRGVAFEPEAIWLAMESDDALAVAVGRLLMLTDPYPLPEPLDAAGGWDMYAYRLWRPGKPHPETWAKYHAATLQALGFDR